MSGVAAARTVMADARIYPSKPAYGARSPQGRTAVDAAEAPWSIAPPGRDGRQPATEAGRLSPIGTLPDYCRDPAWGVVSVVSASPGTGASASPRSVAAFDPAPTRATTEIVSLPTSTTVSGWTIRLGYQSGLVGAPPRRKDRQIVADWLARERIHAFPARLRPLVVQSRSGAPAN